MKIIEVNKLPSAISLNLGALRSSSKRPGVVEALPEITYVRPRVVVDGNLAFTADRISHFAGDRLAIDVSVAAGAHLSVLGQGAAKLFPSPHGIPAEVTTSLAVAAGASLRGLPGGGIPYRGTCFASASAVPLYSAASSAWGKRSPPPSLCGTSTWACSASSLTSTRLRPSLSSNNAGSR